MIIYIIIFSFHGSVYGDQFRFNETQSISYLNKRIMEWPHWSFSGFLLKENMKKNFTYPDWFKGEWLVSSYDISNPSKESIQHLARFKLMKNNIIADNIFNAQSLGNSVFGDNLVNIKAYPNQPERQLILFKDGTFLETKIIGRFQEGDKDNSLITDELSFNIFHNSAIPRLNTVETISQFKLCSHSEAVNQGSPPNSICGEQWLVSYGIKTGNLLRQGIHSEHYRLILIPHQK